MTYEKLDNPVWFSLQESHHQFAIGKGNVRFYREDVCPFGGFIDGNDIIAAIDGYARLTADFFVVGKRPQIPPNVELYHELVCEQMILEELMHVNIDEEIIPLNGSYEDELFRLVDLVQPGYFRKHTSLLGKYFGIFKNGMLVAACGERMKTNEHTEISAVVTHPKHTGKGYAKQLITRTVEHILHENKLCYLHVSEKNMHAIRIYEKLGFKLRRKISFWNLRVKYSDDFRKERSEM